MKPVEFRLIRQCSHKKPCEAPPESEALTPWRHTQTVEIVPPARWTVEALDQFVKDLAASANISDLGLVEFRGDTVTVSGNGHSISLPIAGLIPGSVLGPWLLDHRGTGDVWTAVYRPQPVDPRGQVRQPQGGA